jgi:hypothetical protein
MHGLSGERSIYQVLPDLTTEEYETLKRDISERGVMVPIELDEQGNVLDGHHRLRACEELGITDYPTVVREFKTEQEKRFHARQLNVARRHLSQEQRRTLIQEQLAETPELSDRQIAAGLGVSHVTVGAHRKELESIGQIDQCDRQTADGRTYPTQRKEMERTAEIPQCNTPTGQSDQLKVSTGNNTQNRKQATTTHNDDWECDIARAIGNSLASAAQLDVAPEHMRIFYDHRRINPENHDEIIVEILYAMKKLQTLLDFVKEQSKLRRIK